MGLQELAQAIEASTFGTYLRETPEWFPMLNLAHILGLLLAAGTIVFWDLRLLGKGLTTVPVSEMGRSLLPFTWVGFSIMSVSGALLFALEAGRLYENLFFRIKVICLILAGLNVMFFHFRVYRSVRHWEQQTITPIAARMAGGFSIALWFVILAAGRAIGYTLNYGA
jgi:hypothetical protein